MDNNSFMLSIIAKLNKQLSKSAINNDLKTLDNTMSVRVLAKLSKTLARKELNKSLKELDSLYVNVGAKAKLNKDAKKKLQQDIQYLQRTISDLEIGLKASKASRFYDNIDNIRQRAQKKAQSSPINFNLEIKKNKLISDIEYLGKRYSKLFSNVSASNKYENILNNAYNVSNKQQLADTRAELEAFTSELKANGLAAQSTGDKWGKLIDRAKELFSAAAIVRVIFTQVRQAVSTAIDLDKVYTDLVKVNDQLERGNYAKYLLECNKRAKELATTQKALIEGATEFSKSGYDLVTSDKLTTQSTILSNVGDMSASDSAKAIISGVQAYEVVDGYTDVVNKAQALIDKYNEIGNTASITTSEIAQGVQSVGAVFSDANTSIDEFISLLAAGNRQYQNADALALSLRTAALRIRGCTLELEAMGEETDTVVTSAAKLEEKIKALTNINGSSGVEILEADGETFRSIYDIFLDISKVYQQMSDTDASALLELIAGKNRASAISAVLNNMSEAQKIYQRSLNATGSAQEEYNKYLESTEAHIKQFQASLVETYTSFINGDMVSHVADIGTVILDLNNKTGLLQHTLIAIAALKIGEGITSIGGAIAGTISQMNTLGSALQQVKNLPLDDVLRRDALDDLGEATKSLTEKNLKLLLSQKGLEESDRIAVLRKHDLTEAEAVAKLEKMGLTDATKKNTAANIVNAGSANVSKGAFTGLATSIKATWAAMSLLEKASIIFAAVSTVWSVYSMIVDKNNQKLEEARQKAVELTKAYKEQQSSLESQTAKYKELKETLDKGNLSTDETRSIKEQLLEIQNSLIDSYGNEASNLDLVNGKYREQIDLLNDLSKEKAADYVVEHRDDFEEAKKALERVRSYDLGSFMNLGIFDSLTEDQKKLRDYIESYSDLFTIVYEDHGGSSDYKLLVQADAESADEVIRQFAKDLENWVEHNNLDVDITQFLTDGISKQIDDILTDEIKEYREIYDEFMKAEIVRNDTLRPLYQQSIQAVEDYNKALSSEEGVEEARAILESVQQSVQAVTGELEGSQEIFDDIYEGINKNTEAAYNLNQAFENNDAVKEYAEQLRGLSDVDIKAINFDNDNLELGEEAFRGLIDVLGLTEDQAQNVIDKLVELGYVYGSVVDSGASIDSPTFDITTHKDSIDDFQSKIKTLGDTLSSIQSGTFEDSDLTDLLQEFPELADKTDDLENAIVELINNALKALYNTLGEEIPDGLKVSLQEIADIASGTAKHLGDAFSDIHDSWDILHDFKDTMDKGFDSNVTDSLLQSVRGLSGELETLVAGYYSGVVSAEQLYEALTQHYENDLHNYSEALIKKNELNEDFYNAVGLASEEVTNQFRDDYDVDIKNCTTYNQAKLEIEKQTLGQISAMWSQYYDAQSKTLKMSMSEIEARATHGGGDAAEFLKQYELIENYEAAIEALNNITYEGIRSNFESIGSKLGANGSGSGSSSDFEETFDWIETAIDRIERSISNLDLKASSVYRSWSERNSNLKAELLDVKKEMDIQASGYNKYMQQANSVGLSEEWASKVRNGQINISSITDKTLAKRIKEYQDWYRNMPLYLVTGGGILFNC